MADDSAGTGLAELDRALGGLYWGDNVVWVWEGGQPSAQALFYDAIARRGQGAGNARQLVRWAHPAVLLTDPRREGSLQRCDVRDSDTARRKGARARRRRDRR